MTITPLIILIPTTWPTLAISWSGKNTDTSFPGVLTGTYTRSQKGFSQHWQIRTTDGSMLSFATQCFLGNLNALPFPWFQGHFRRSSHAYLSGCWKILLWASLKSLETKLHTIINTIERCSSPWLRFPMGDSFRDQTFWKKSSLFDLFPIGCAFTFQEKETVVFPVMREDMGWTKSAQAHVLFPGTFYEFVYIRCPKHSINCRSSGISWSVRACWPQAVGRAGFELITLRDRAC